MRNPSMLTRQSLIPGVICRGPPRKASSRHVASPPLSLIHTIHTYVRTFAPQHTAPHLGCRPIVVWRGGGPGGANSNESRSIIIQSIQGIRLVCALCTLHIAHCRAAERFPVHDLCRRDLIRGGLCMYEYDTLCTLTKQGQWIPGYLVPYIDSTSPPSFPIFPAMIGR